MITQSGDLFRTEVEAEEDWRLVATSAFCIQGQEHVFIEHLPSESNEKEAEGLLELAEGVEPPTY